MRSPESDPAPRAGARAPGDPAPAPPSVELVVARYREDLRWTRNVPRAVRVTIYDKGDAPAPDRDGIPLPNVGREAHTYLHHIVSRYDSLAPLTVFCQGHPFDHAHDLHATLRGLVGGAIDPPDFLWLGFLVDTDDPRGRRLFVGWSKNPRRRELPLDRVHLELFGAPCPALVHFHVGAQFVARARAIRSRPREFYERALALAARDDLAAHCMERIWDRVFGPPAVDPATLDHNLQRFLKPIRRRMIGHE